MSIEKIKVGELRVGSSLVTINNPKYWPKLKGRIFVVVAISKNNNDYSIGLNSLIKKENFVDPLFSQFLKYIEPLLLTEKFLLENGWELDYERGDLKSFINYSLDIDAINFIPSKGKFYFNCWENSIELKYIHTVQNLYFSLKGTELIKL